MMPLPEGDQPMPVDPEILQMLADLQEPGEPDLLRELITLFLRDTPERLDTALRALAASDFDTAGRAAHSVKGSAANLGAHALQAHAGTAEAAARRQDASALTTALVALDEEFALVRAQLERVRATRPH